MKARRASALLLSALLAPGAAMAQPAASWDFVVRLDGRKVGTHSFTLQDDGPGGRQLASLARFDVKLLGITVYRYRHVSHEKWRSGCLAAIDARTDDAGKHSEVHGQEAAQGFSIDGVADPVPGCLMTFAYWDSRLSGQSRLLDPGSGRVVPVRVSPLPAAKGWRIEGLPNPIDVLWEGGRWIGLDTAVGGRQLTYRLQ